MGVGVGGSAGLGVVFGGLAVQGGVQVVADPNGHFRADPAYPSYLRFRTVAMQPGTIIMVACGFAIWSGLIYWRSRTRPLTDLQKIVFICLLLSTVGGYILTAWFKL